MQCFDHIIEQSFPIWERHNQLKNILFIRSVKVVFARHFFWCEQNYHMVIVCNLTQNIHRNVGICDNEPPLG